jgi:hypothetical protein
MKLVYAIGQWTNSNRLTARHIDNGEGKPLCGGNGREPLFWAPEEGEPTCKICMDLALMLHQGEPEKANSRQINGD